MTIFPQTFYSFTIYFDVKGVISIPVCQVQLTLLQINYQYFRLVCATGRSKNVFLFIAPHQCRLACLRTYMTSFLIVFIPRIYVLLTRYILKNSGQRKYLHSAVIMEGLMMVFGGNTHNDTSMSYGAKCYSTDFVAYDIGNN